MLFLTAFIIVGHESVENELGSLGLSAISVKYPGLLVSPSMWAYVLSVGLVELYSVPAPPTKEVQAVNILELPVTAVVLNLLLT